MSLDVRTLKSIRTRLRFVLDDPDCRLSIESRYELGIALRLVRDELVHLEQELALVQMTVPGAPAEPIRLRP